MLNIKEKFTKDQLSMLNNIGIVLLNNKDYSDDELMEIHDMITDYYILNGFDEEYEPNEIALSCESLIDLFYDEFKI